jgi:hypothetical protein
MTPAVAPARPVKAVIMSSGVTVTDADTVLALVRAVYVPQTLGLPVAFADAIGGRYDDVVAMTGPSQPGSTQSPTTDTEAAA